METCESSDTMQKQLYGIAIYEEEIVMCDYTGSGERRFVITPEQLMGFFRTGVTFHAFPGLIWLRDNGDGRAWLFTVPAATRTILYRNKKKIVNKTLRLPSLAIRVETAADSEAIKSIRLWGFAGRELTRDSVLYEIPLPNFSGSSLCLGSTIKAAADDIREATLRTVFDTPFNHHNDVVGKARLSFSDYHKQHRGKCPLHTLKILGKGREILEAKA